AFVQHAFLERKLGSRGKMLQAAAAAHAMVGTGSVDTVGRRRQYPQGTGFGPGGTTAGELRLYPFSWQRAVDEYNPSLQVGDAAPFMTQLVDVEALWFPGKRASVSGAAHTHAPNTPVDR